MCHASNNCRRHAGNRRQVFVFTGFAKIDEPYSSSPQKINYDLGSGAKYKFEIPISLLRQNRNCHHAMAL